MELFWQTLATYNRTTWPVQLLFVLAGILLTRMLYRRPQPGVKVAVKIFLALLNGWIAAAYYLYACAERPFSGVMALLWGVMAAVWIYDLAVGYTLFERTRRHDAFACVLYAVPFLFPLLSLLRGMEFPAVASPVIPSAAAVFELALLLGFSKRINLFVILFFCHWSLIAFPKVYSYGMPEDLLLAGAMVPAVYLFLSDYIELNFREDTKPGVRVMRMLVVSLCAGLALFFLVALVRQFGR